MSLKIRLARAGTKKRPVYHIVIADSRAPRDGRYIERLGYFNPLLAKDNKDRLKLDLEKVKAWMAKGALPTDRVSRFLDDAGRREARDAQQSREGEAEEEGAGARRGGCAAAARSRPKARLAAPPELRLGDRARLHRADRRRARCARRGAAEAVHRGSARRHALRPARNRGRPRASRSRRCGPRRTCWSRG